MLVGIKPYFEAHESFAAFGTSFVSRRKANSATKSESTVRCLVYPAEIGWRKFGDGWLFLMAHRPKKKAPVSTSIIPTYRAGPEDIRVRSPAVRTLESKRIAVFGLGAIGAPVAVELARNGCFEMRLLEYDKVEPGNTVRWPLGASAWGLSKLNSVIRCIENEYPGTRVIPIPHRLGTCFLPGQGEGVLTCEEALNMSLEGADLAIDTTAEIGINRLLTDHCSERMIPLIVADATPSVQGGVVARYSAAKGDGCQICLENYRADGKIPKPSGWDTPDDQLFQPPGCAEPTFIGANFDLAEISMQAVRLAVDTLSPSPGYPRRSRVFVLSFLDSDGHLAVPSWESFPLPVHKNCDTTHPS